jgi:hypothetical protein
MLSLYPEMVQMDALQRAWPSLARAVALKREAEGKPDERGAPDKPATNQ